MALLHQTVTSLRNIKMFFMRGKPSLINVPYFLTQRLLYRIGDKLLSDFEEAAK
jgi:hypothetical protein